jgi:hypothetical protein
MAASISIISTTPKRTLLAVSFSDGESASETMNCKSALTKFADAKMYLGAAAEDLMHREPTLDMRLALSSAIREIRKVQERLETKCLVRG